MMRQSRGEKIAERLGWILLQLYTGNSLSVNDICQQFLFPVGQDDGTY